MLRSPYAHARVLSIDTSEAETLDGVVTVVTGTEIADFIPPFVAGPRKTRDQDYAAVDPGDR